MFFIHDQRWKNGKKVKEYFWGFLVWHHEHFNKKLVHDALIKIKEKYTF